jgi:hypothetical protein
VLALPRARIEEMAAHSLNAAIAQCINQQILGMVLAVFSPADHTLEQAGFLWVRRWPTRASSKVTLIGIDQ